jgi:hypothetical protein
MKKLIKKPKSVKTETVQSNSESENKINNSPKGLKKLPAKLKLTKKKLLIILVTILVLTSLGYLGMFLGNKYLWPPKPYCHIRLAHLVCMNINTLQETRYDLPKIDNEEITNLWPSYDQNYYVARINKTNGKYNHQSYYLLDSQLKNPKLLPGQIADDLPRTEIVALTWSRDNTSLFFVVGYYSNYKFLRSDTYKYDISNNRKKKFNSKQNYDNLYQLENKKLLYEEENAAISLKPSASISNEDGTDRQPFAEEELGNREQLGIKKYDSWLYDNNSDSVFYWTYHPASDISKTGTTTSYDEATQTLTYFKANQPKKTKTIEIGLDLPKSQFLFFRKAGDKIIGLKSAQRSNYYEDSSIESSGAIINAKNGQIINNLYHVWVDVGFMSPAKLTKSQEQIEYPYERIIGLYKAPDAMKPIIIKEFDAKDKECYKAGEYNSLQFGVYFRNENEISFGTGAFECAWSKKLYRKTNVGWVEFRPPSPANGLLDCADLDKYKISAKEYPKCNDYKNNRFGADGAGVPNRNP